MLVADPTLTRDDASEIATIIARRLSVDYFELLERLRKPDTRFQYLARRVPSTVARDVLAEIDARGLLRRRAASATRCVTTPARTSPPTSSAS